MDSAHRSGSHVLQNITKINPKILEMVSENDMMFMMLMMLCTSVYTKRTSPWV